MHQNISVENFDFFHLVDFKKIFTTRLQGFIMHTILHNKDAQGN